MINTCGRSGTLLRLFKQSLPIAAKEKNESSIQCMLTDCNGEHTTEGEMPWKLQKQALVTKLLLHHWRNLKQSLPEAIAKQVLPLQTSRYFCSQLVRLLEGDNRLILIFHKKYCFLWIDMKLQMCDICHLPWSWFTLAGDDKELGTNHIWKAIDFSCD